MKKRVLLSLAAIMLLAGCNGNSGSDSASLSSPSSSTKGSEVSTEISNSSSTGSSVVADEVTEIEIEDYPSKVEYNIGEELDISGITIYVTYSSGKHEVIPVTSDMVEMPNMNHQGKGIVVTINYGGQTTSYQIDIVDPNFHKETPTIVIKADGNTFENGTEFTTDNIPTFTFEVTEGVVYDYNYSMDDGETDLGKNKPTEPGVYAINVQTIENDLYSATRVFQWYRIVEPTNKSEPTFTFSIENGTHFKVGEIPAITASVNEDGVEANVWFSKDDGETNLGAAQPTEPGTYAINIQTVENDLYVSKHAFRWFVIDAPLVKSEPTLTFSIESGTHFKAGEVPAITASVNEEGVEANVWFSKDDGATNLGATQPTEPGTYAINIQTVENDIYASISGFRWFVIDSNETKDIVVIFTDESEFAYDGNPHTPAVLSITDDVEYVVHYEQNEVSIGTAAPTEPGEYSMVVELVDSNSGTLVRPWWKPFTIVDNTSSSALKKVLPR